VTSLSVVWVARYRKDTTRVQDIFSLETPLPYPCLVPASAASHHWLTAKHGSSAKSLIHFSIYRVCLQGLFREYRVGILIQAYHSIWSLNLYFCLLTQNWLSPYNLDWWLCRLSDRSTILFVFPFFILVFVFILYVQYFMYLLALQYFAYSWTVCRCQTALSVLRCQRHV